MSDDKSTREQWLEAYNNMMVRVKTAIEEAEEAEAEAYIAENRSGAA